MFDRPIEDLWEGCDHEDKLKERSADDNPN